MNGHIALAKGLEVFDGKQLFLLKNGRAILREDDFTPEELELWVKFLRERKDKATRGSAKPSKATPKD